jgi:hypothetical protein
MAGIELFMGYLVLHHTNRGFTGRYSFMRSEHYIQS